MGTLSRHPRFTIRGLMLLIAFSALMLARGIAIWEWVELSRRTQSPWWNTQEATARAWRAALATVNEQAETRPQLQTASPDSLTPNRAPQHTRSAE
jgi:hypothetical protein